MIMKKKSCLQIIYCLLFSVFISCVKERYKLPPETQTGANTFGCVLNGKVWSPRGSDGYSGTNKARSYSYNGCYFILSATDHDGKPLSGIVLGFDSTCMQVGIPIKLAAGRKGEGGAGYHTIGYAATENNDFGTSDSVTGELVFTKWEPPITSGRFWFDAIDKNGNIIHVTDGRFDVNR